MAKIEDSWLEKAPQVPKCHHHTDCGYITNGEVDEIGRKIAYIEHEKYWLYDMDGVNYDFTSSVEFFTGCGKVLMVKLTNKNKNCGQIDYYEDGRVKNHFKYD